MSRASGPALDLCSLLLRGFYTTAFQPLVETVTGKTIGYESFLRGPEGTALSSPARMFAEHGAVPDAVRFQVDRMALDSAVRTGRNLPGNTLLFINILRDTIETLAGSLDEFLALLAELCISPSRLVFELSESSGVNGMEHLVPNLISMRAVGIRFALDNIGIRSPILQHLMLLHPDFLKLDWLFVKGIASNVRKQELVRCMVHMSERMGGRLVAGGVESRHELEAVQMLGVPLSQGFYLGHAQAAEHWQE